MSRLSSVLRWGTAPVALLAASALVYAGSVAAFSATTTNTGNSWTSGSVVLSDDDAGTALFSASALRPGDTQSRCLAVTYSGSLAATERMYGTVGGSGLAGYLTTTITRKTGDFAADCVAYDADSAPATAVFTGTLADFGATHGSYATGTTGVAVSTGTVITYKITYRVVDDNAAQGKDATAEFIWEAQS